MPRKQGRVQGTRTREDGDDAVLRAVIPIGRSGYAIAAGYLGIFAIFVIPAPIAVVVSIIAILDLRENRDKHGWGRAIFGLVMGTLFTLLLLLYLFVG